MNKIIVSDFEDAITALAKTYNKLKRKLNSAKFKEWHRNLWDNGADEEEWFKFAQAFGFEGNFGDFDHTWQNRTLLHENYEQAKIEFLNSMLGWF